MNNYSENELMEAYTFHVDQTKQYIVELTEIQALEGLWSQISNYKNEFLRSLGKLPTKKILLPLR